MNRNGTFVTDQLDVRKVWREHFEILCNFDSNKEGIVYVCMFDGVKRNIFRG